MKKTLSEAAAEILSASHSSAPAQPQQHLGAGSDQDDESELGTGQDLGGDEPDDVASENPDATGPIGQAKKPGPSGRPIAPKVGQMAKAGLKTNNQNISDIDPQSRGTNTTGDQLDHVKTTSTQSEDTDNNDEEMVEVEVDADGNPILAEDDETDSVILFDREQIYEEFKSALDEDLGDLLDADETLTEDFKKKAKAVFEASVMARVNTMADLLEQAFVQTLEEAIDEIKGDLTEKTNDYLSYVAEEWIKENEIAVEKSLRSELTEDFINGLKTLFLEHWIDIPEDKVDVVQELTNEVEEVEDKLNEEIQANVELAKAVKSYQAQEAFTTVCGGLTDVQKDKMKSLAEGLEFTTEGEYKERLELVRDNYFLAKDDKKIPTKTDGGLNESIEFIDEKGDKKSTSNDSEVKAFAAALSRSSSK